VLAERLTADLVLPGWKYNLLMNTMERCLADTFAGGMRRVTCPVARSCSPCSEGLTTNGTAGNGACGALNGSVLERVQSCHESDLGCTISYVLLLNK
jgi:hypothetical protein